MASFFSSHKYQKLPSGDYRSGENDTYDYSNKEDEAYDIKMAYQYTTSPFSSTTRGARSDSSGSYSSVASSDSHYEKLAPSGEEVTYYESKALPSTPAEQKRRVRFQVEKELPALPEQERVVRDRKPRRMSSRDGAYAWFAQRRYQMTDERLEDSMEKRDF